MKRFGSAKTGINEQTALHCANTAISELKTFFKTVALWPLVLFDTNNENTKITTHTSLRLPDSPFSAVAKVAKPLMVMNYYQPI